MAKLDQLNQEQADASLIKVAEETLAETMAVLPSCVQKIEHWVQELSSLMATIEDQNQENITEIKEAEEWTNAQQAISAANEYLESL